jgi:hypothetical protein
MVSFPLAFLPITYTRCSSHRLDLVRVQEVRWEGSGTAPAGEYTHPKGPWISTGLHWARKLWYLWCVSISGGAAVHWDVIPWYCDLRWTNLYPCCDVILEQWWKDNWWVNGSLCPSKNPTWCLPGKVGPWGLKRELQTNRYTMQVPFMGSDVV